MSGGNWWEYYFVRYFIGSVFGAIIAFGLLLHPDSGIHYIVSSFMVVDGFSLRDVSMPLLFMVLCLGVAFCYLSVLQFWFYIQSGIQFYMAKQARQTENQRCFCWLCVWFCGLA